MKRKFTKYPSNYIRSNSTILASNLDCFCCGAAADLTLREMFEYLWDSAYGDYDDAYSGLEAAYSNLETPAGLNWGEVEYEFNRWVDENHPESMQII